LELLNNMGIFIKDYGPTISTFVLIAVTWKYVTEVRRQSTTMAGQACIMKRQMETDRLVRKHEKLTKEMTYLVGPLYVAKDHYLIIESGGYNSDSPCYREHRSFWDDIKRNMHLAQRDLLPKLEDYFSAMKTYEHSPRSLYGETTESARKDFDAKKDDLIQQIDISYTNLSNEIRKTEKELDSVREMTCKEAKK